MADLSVQEDGGGDYDTLDGAVDNIVATNDINIEGFWDNADTTACSTGVNNVDVTTDSDSETTPAKHVAGVPTHYRLEVGSGPHAFTLNNTGWTLTGVEIKQTGGSSDECIRIASCDGAFGLTDCILYTDRSSNDMDCVHWNNGTEGSHVSTFTNCIFYYAERSPLNIYSATGGAVINVIACTIYFYGDAAEGDSAGIYARFGGSSPANSLNVYNTILGGQQHGSNEDIVVDQTNNNISVDRCIFGDAAGSDHFDYDNDNLKSRSFADTDQGAGDYVIFIGDIDGAIPWDLSLRDLGSAKNNAQDAHTDSAMDDEVGGQTITMPGTDIAGTARPQNNNYDVGATEIAAGGTTYQGTCTDGLALGESVVRIATLRGSITDGLDLGESPGVLSSLLATLSDGVSIGESLDLVTTFDATAADGVSLADTAAINAIFGRTAADGLTMGESLAVTATLLALASDVSNLSDSPGVTASLLASISDGFELSEPISAMLTRLATAVDSIIGSESVVGTILLDVIQALAADGVKFVAGPSTDLFDQETLGSELVTNGDMELDSDWDDRNTPATNERSVEQLYSGTYSRKFVGDSQYDGIKTSIDISLTVGKVYKFVMWIYGDAAGDQIRCVSDVKPAPSIKYWFINDVAYAAGWTEVTQYFIATRTESIALEIFNVDATPTGVFYFDDVSIREVTAPPKGIPVNDPWPALAGVEAITDSDDRDFGGGDVGNWVVVKTGPSPAGTCTYDSTDLNFPGESGDNKQMVLTSDSDNGLFTNLSVSAAGGGGDIILTPNTLHKISAKVAVPAANTLQTVQIYMYQITGELPTNFTQVLTPDTWETVEWYVYFAADVVGSINIGFNGNPTDADLMYIDDISIRPVQFSWRPYGTNTMEIDESEDALKISYVDHAGGAYLYMQDSFDLSADLHPGSQCFISVEAKATTADVITTHFNQFENPGTQQDTFGTLTTSFVTYTGLINIIAADNRYLRFSNMTTNDEVWIRNLSIIIYPSFALLTARPTAFDGLSLSEQLATELSALASAADGFDLSDIIAAGQNAAAVDGFELSAAVAGLMRFVGLASDGLTVTDSPAGTLFLTATATDQLQFAEAVGGIMKFVALASDSLQISDVNYWLLPSGAVSISFSVKKARVTFTIEKPGITFTAKKPGIDFS